MAYLTRDDLATRIGETELRQILAADSARGTDEERLSMALADAEALLDLHIGSRYPLPLTTVPEALARMCADVARYYLWDNGAPQIVTDRYAAVQEVLKSIAAGDLTLSALDGAARATAASLTSATRVMTRDGLSGVL